MKNKFFGAIILCSLVLVACGVKNYEDQSPAVSQTKVSGHPELSENEKLIACSSCHREVTPEIYEQWYNSVHGLDNVKCFQCHGTYENFRAIPQVSQCSICHMDQFRKMPPDKTCWQCHPAHKFSVHK
ncbi:cytochrome c3 family protein [Thermosulfuriphilus sp.]